MIKKKEKAKPKRVPKNTKKKFVNKGKAIVAFPTKLLNPVGKFLQARLKLLEKRRKEIEEEDPFQDVSRITDNAAPDADAAEQFGHARTSAIREQIDRKMIQTRKALARVKIGKYGICEFCGEMIDTDRLIIYPEATLCARDAAKKEK